MEEKCPFLGMLPKGWLKPFFVLPLSITNKIKALLIIFEHVVTSSCSMTMFNICICPKFDKLGTLKQCFCLLYHTKVSIPNAKLKQAMLK